VRRAELVTAAVLAVLSVFLMIKSAELPIGWNARQGGPAGGAFPFWLGGAMLLSSAWIFVRALRGVTPESRSTEPFMDRQTLKLFVVTAGALGLMIGAIHFIGVYGALPLYFIFYMRFVGRHPWRTVVPIVILVPIALFFLFEVALKIILPKGYLEFLFIELGIYNLLTLL
jgi:hypothetical protein